MEPTPLNLPEGPLWVLYDHMADDKFEASAQWFYHGIMMGKSRGYSCLEAQPVDPLEIIRIAPFVPPIADVLGNMVVCEELRDKLMRDVSDCQLREAVFSKLVRCPWKPGDKLPELDGVYPDELIFSGEHCPQLEKEVGRHYEVVMSSYYRFLEAHIDIPFSCDKEFTVVWGRISSDREKYPWYPNYFAERRICKFSSFYVLHREVLEILLPYLDPDWFRWHPWVIKDGIFDLHTLQWGESS